MRHDRDCKLTRSAGTGRRDDVRAKLSRSGDDLYRTPRGFPTKSYTDGLKYRPSPPRVAIYDVEDVVGIAPSVVHHAVSTSFQLVVEALIEW